MVTAVVLGGGIAGLAAGLALSQAGWRTRVVERAPHLEAVGAALSLWPNATAGLARLGVLDEVRRRGRPFRTMLVADRRERPIIPVRQVDGEALMVTRTDLQEVLMRALPDDVLMLGRSVDRVDSEGSVSLRFADGATETADIIVDAGGLRSVAADATDVSYRGYGGVVALSDPVCNGGADDGAAEYWGWRERFGLFALPGNRRYWFFMRDQSADALPPSRNEILVRAARFAPAVGRAVAATPADRLIPFAIHARQIPTTLGSGRLIRVGDAAHAMEPNLGQGACQAIEDAVALGAVAATYPADDILAAYERLRLRRVAGIVRRAAEGRHGAHGPLAVQWAMRSLLRMIPTGDSERLARSIQTMPAYVG